MQCRIINIGDELLIGDTINTSGSWLARELTEVGIEVTHICAIKDELATMKEILSESLSRADLVITTGGLGPTHDDMTKQAVSELFDTELIVHQPTLDFIKKMFRKRNIPFSKSNYHQAEVPAGCEVLFNENGTAPGLWFEKEATMLAVLPGVPYEMKQLMKNEVMPRVRDKQTDTGIRKAYYLLTAGIGESTLSDEIIGDLDTFLDSDISVAYLPSPDGTRIRVRAGASTEAELDQKVAPLLKHIRQKAGIHLVGEGKERVLAEAVGDLLARKNLHIATAESCTGGGVLNRLTDIPGSSRYVSGGIVAYDNAVKHQQLQVSEEVLQQVGAVSKEVALQMARAAARNIGADIGISTTGIAGPSGGSPEKPVGLVWIGFWGREEHFALKAQFTNKRLINKQRTITVALETVRRVVSGIQEMPYGLKKQTL